MLWWTFQNLVTTGLLAGLVWLVCRVTRIGPVARHALWLVVLLKLLMPPMVAWPWRVPDPVARLMPQDLPRVVQVEARVNTVEPTPSLPDVVGETQVPFLPEIPSEPQVEGPPAPATVQTVAPPPAIPAPTPPIITPAPEPQHFLPVVPVAWLAIVLRWAGRVWVAGGICFALVHLARIVRMLRVRGRAMPAEAEQAGRIAAMAEELSSKLGLRPVRTRVVAGIRSPLIWCLLRPEMLWPSALPESAEASLRGLIVHELAHVKRGDHRVGWLELIAGCVWWWNPLFWYVRHQLRENAELACDAWVVQTLPGTRRAYAEGLLAVCESLLGLTSNESNSARVSRPPHPMPALGVGTGGRRILERRLAMILRDRVPLRLPRTGLMMIGLLMLAVLPMWSQNSGAQPLGPESAGSEAVARLPNPQGGTASQLPPDAQDAIQKFEQQQMEARRELERRLAEQRDVLVRQLKELQDRYTRAGQLDEAVAVRDRVRQLQGESAYGAGEPIPDPGNAIQFRGREHQSIRIMVTGATDGWIWGANPYTDDSSIATAAVQAGILRPGERGVVRIRMLPGRDHYEAATFNGVTSQAYGPWPGSYLIEPERIARPAKLHSYGPPPSALPDPGTLTEYRGHIGENFVFTVVGSTAATIWGTGTYTDDSPLSVVAVHAGLVSPGESKVVRVIILPGQDHYQGSTQNGVTSQDWGNFAGSYQVSALDAPTNGPRTSFGRPGDRIWQDAVPLPSGPRGDGTPSAAGPLNLMSLRDTAAALKEGRHLTLHCQIRGSNVGTVWGTGTYTDDSSIAAAAVHEGVLTDGQLGWVNITLLPGQDHYSGSARNGVSSFDYGPWGGSFSIQPGEPTAGPDVYEYEKLSGTATRSK